MATHLQQLLDTKLSDLGGLHRYVIAEAVRGHSWRAIARNIRDLTDIPVTDESLRDWYGDQVRAAREDAARRITNPDTTQ